MPCESRRAFVGAALAAIVGVLKTNDHARLVIEPTRQRVNRPTTKTRLPLPRDPRLGRVVKQRYTLLRLIEEGGFGRVFEACDRRQRRLALKLLLPDATQVHSMLAALFDEARAMRALSQRNCVEVFDYGVCPANGPYMAMELVDGPPLSEFIGLPLPVDFVCNVAEQLLAGLEHAHRHGVIHGDVKPDNILLATRDEGYAVKLCDFSSPGWIVDCDELTTQFTATRSYLAPELLDGAPATPRSDIYAVGVLLRLMLTGCDPFAGMTMAQTLRAKRASCLPGADQREHANPLIDGVVACAAQRRPEQRWSSARHMRVALLEARLAESQGASAPAQQRPRRSRASGAWQRVRAFFTPAKPSIQT